MSHVAHDITQGQDPMLSPAAVPVDAGVVVLTMSQVIARLFGRRAGSALFCVCTDAVASVRLRPSAPSVWARVRWAIREQTQRDPCLPAR